jgi:hypothetical protein
MQPGPRLVLGQAVVAEDGVLVLAAGLVEVLAALHLHPGARAPPRVTHAGAGPPGGCFCSTAIVVQCLLPVSSEPCTPGCKACMHARLWRAAHQCMAKSSNATCTESGPQVSTLTTGPAGRAGAAW